MSHNSFLSIPKTKQRRQKNIRIQIIMEQETPQESTICLAESMDTIELNPLKVQNMCVQQSEHSGEVLLNQGCPYLNRFVPNHFLRWSAVFPRLATWGLENLHYEIIWTECRRQVKVLGWKGNDDLDGPQDFRGTIP